VQNLGGESMEGMTMEVKKQGSTLLRQKSSSVENDAVRGEELCRTWGLRAWKG
jgi:hypothetical protein